MRKMIMTGVSGGLERLSPGEEVAIRPREPYTLYKLTNIGHSGDVEIITTNGDVEVKMDKDDGEGSWIGYPFYSTENRYYKIRNVDSGDINISYEIEIYQIIDYRTT